MISNTMTCEMFDDFSGGLGVQQTLVVPPTPMDSALFAFDKKARDSNRFPARVLNDCFIQEVSTGNVEIVDDYGNPATMQKAVTVEDDDSEPIDVSPELQAEILKIS